MTSYLSPESLNQIQRLDLRARMVVKGFLQGLHGSPYHGFSVQFSDHRRYHPGDRRHPGQTELIGDSPASNFEASAPMKRGSPGASKATDPLLRDA